MLAIPLQWLWSPYCGCGKGDALTAAMTGLWLRLWRLPDCGCDCGGYDYGCVPDNADCLTEAAAIT